MPTYDYVCRACGHTFESFQSLSEGKLRKCPKCARLKLERLIGAGAGILFKGSGFYETDYKRADRPAEKPNGKGDSGSEKAEPTPRSDKSDTSDTSAKPDKGANPDSSGASKTGAGADAKGKKEPGSSSGSGSSDKKTS